MTTIPADLIVTAANFKGSMQLPTNGSAVETVTPVASAFTPFAPQPFPQPQASAPVAPMAPFGSVAPQAPVAPVVPMAQPQAIDTATPVPAMSPDGSMQFAAIDLSTIGDGPVLGNWSSLARVTNSGMYKIEIYKAVLASRLVRENTIQGIKETSRLCVEVRAYATLLADKSHTGRIAFKVDLPVTGMPRNYDRFFYELAYFTGSYTTNAQGRFQPSLETKVVPLPYVRYDGATEEREIPKMEGAKLHACFARRENKNGSNFFMNIQGFFGLDLRSLNEVQQNIPNAIAYKQFASMYKSEGHALDYGDQSGNSNTIAQVRAAASAGVNAGTGASTLVGNGFQTTAAQPQGQWQQKAVPNAYGAQQPQYRSFASAHSQGTGAAKQLNAAFPTTPVYQPQVNAAVTPVLPREGNAQPLQQAQAQPQSQPVQPSTPVMTNVATPVVSTMPNPMFAAPAAPVTSVAPAAPVQEVTGGKGSNDEIPF